MSQKTKDTFESEECSSCLENKRKRKEESIVKCKVFVQSNYIIPSEPKIHLVNLDGGNLSFQNFKMKLELLCPGELFDTCDVFWFDADGDQISIQSDEGLKTAVQEMSDEIKQIHVSLLCAPLRFPNFPSSQSSSQLWELGLHNGVPCTGCKRKPIDGYRFKCLVRKLCTPGHIHTGVACNSCKTEPISGCRFKCLQCKDFNLCCDCEKKTGHSHHSMLRMPIRADLRINSISAYVSRMKKKLIFDGTDIPIPTNLDTLKKSLEKKYRYLKNEKYVIRYKNKDANISVITTDEDCVKALKEMAIVYSYMLYIFPVGVDNKEIVRLGKRNPSGHPYHVATDENCETCMKKPLFKCLDCYDFQVCATCYEKEKSSHNLDVCVVWSAHTMIRTKTK